MVEDLVVRSGLETNSLILNKLAKDFILFKSNGCYEKQLESLYNDTLLKLESLRGEIDPHIYKEKKQIPSLTMLFVHYKDRLIGLKNTNNILNELERPLRIIAGAELEDLDEPYFGNVPKDLYVYSFYNVLADYLHDLGITEKLLPLEEYKEKVLHVFIKDQLELVNGLVLEDCLDYTCFLQIKSGLNFVGLYGVKEPLESTYAHFKDETRSYVKSLLSLTVSTKMDSGKERYISFIKQRCNSFDEYYNVEIKKNWII